MMRAKWPIPSILPVEPRPVESPTDRVKNPWAIAWQCGCQSYLNLSTCMHVSIMERDWPVTKSDGRK